MWFWLALGGSIFSSLSIIINKKALRSINPTVLTWVLFAFPIPFLLVYFVVQGFPSVGSLFWIGVFCSAFMFVISKTLTMESIKHDDLSKVYPLNSLSSVFAYFLALLFLSEHITVVALLGLIVSVFGVYILNAGKRGEGLLEPLKYLVKHKGSRIIIIASLLGGATAVTDKMAILGSVTNDPLLPLLAENSIMVLILFFYMQKRERDWTDQVKGNWRWLLIAGILYFITNIFVFTSFAGGPVALAIGIKKLQVLFILVLSLILFKDKPSRYAWLGSVLMLIGVLMIKLGG
ncbi:EamA family transporter [candidate division WWE3 bacterium]|uniref:EamA family transporter n=1 Tax=candidate division WWE3 bacterium TaxID=2053526 RepID=A0A955RQT9_UNCKA|nr:EamA family transporter [candidate division WWE3 bacterium]